ncbi:hypothetical protein EBU95_20970 [bacterium]|nr:hypothetical protein [bacterium]
MLNILENLIETTFDPSAKDMRAFKEAILANKDLANLFNSGTSDNVKKVSVGVAPQISEKKPRAAPQPKANEVRCQALVWNLEKDETTGELKPKRCTRGCDNQSNFCKQHALVDGKRCSDCSNYFGEDIIHQFKHEHMGTIHEPSYIFEKYHNDVLKIYQRGLQTPQPILTQQPTQLPPKNNKKSTTKTHPTADEKPKRPLNPYMKFLQENRKAIGEEILAATPELKGKELQTAITKRAGELWKQQKASLLPIVDDEPAGLEEHPSEIGPQEQEEQQTADGEAQDNEDNEDDEDKITLTYNETLKVWIDEETQLYYDDEQGSDAKGSIVNGSLRPFKVVKKQ